MREAALIITADDYGYRPEYDEGILEAAARGAVDSVSVLLTRRRPDIQRLDATGVELGLHLDLEDGDGDLDHRSRPRAGPAERAAALEALAGQLERFSEAAGRLPAFLDGHHHCHARPGLGAVVARYARELRVPVRSVDQRHRRLLRCRGVPTPDRLIGRVRATEPVLPEPIASILAESPEPPDGVIEWMVHPGNRAGEGASRYDAEREEDLRLLLELAADPRLRRLRRTHADALAR